MIEILPGLSVSRETWETLHHYLAILKEWNQRINLVSTNTLEQAWERHILDSAQLSFYIFQKDATIVDLGSGAGFPGLVLSILGYQNVTLIEADNRKCIFLREVVRQTGAEANVINERIEATDIKADYIVTRAFASLVDTLSIISAQALSGVTLLALKGKSYNDEIEEAKKEYTFDCQMFPNMIDTNGVVLRVANVHTLVES